MTSDGNSAQQSVNWEQEELIARVQGQHLQNERAKVQLEVDKVYLEERKMVLEFDKIKLETQKLHLETLKGS